MLPVHSVFTTCRRCLGYRSHVRYLAVSLTDMRRRSIQPFVSSIQCPVSFVLLGSGNFISKFFLSRLCAPLHIIAHYRFIACADTHVQLDSGQWMYSLSCDQLFICLSVIHMSFLWWIWFYLHVNCVMWIHRTQVRNVVAVYNSRRSTPLPTGTWLPPSSWSGFR